MRVKVYKDGTLMNGRSALLVAACALLPSLSGAQVDSASIRQVLATEDRRFAAMVHTHTDGAQNTRAQFLQIVGTGALRYASIAPEAREVRVFGSSAIVTGQSAMRVEAGGPARAFRIRYLAVYRHGVHGWELIAWQSTRLPT
jgi:ketosteroid isomerase-like protein